MSSLTRSFQRLSLNSIVNVQTTFLRNKARYVEKPAIGMGIAYRRKIHFTEKYTVKPLEVTNLAGRDPKTGRIVVNGIGGGIKHKYHWIDWKRIGPTEGPPSVHN